MEICYLKTIEKTRKKAHAQKHDFTSSNGKSGMKNGFYSLHEDIVKNQVSS
jgi:hypothetical protein